MSNGKTNSTIWEMEYSNFKFPNETIFEINLIFVQIPENIFSKSAKMFFIYYKNHSGRMPGYDAVSSYN